jgi:hypothetical protein
MDNKKIWEIVDNIYKNHAGWPTDSNSSIIGFGKPSGIKIRKILSGKISYEVMLWMDKFSFMGRLQPDLILSFKIKYYNDVHSNIYYEMWDLTSTIPISKPIAEYDIYGHIVRLMRDYNLKEILDE